jgi:hypothetical protein
MKAAPMLSLRAATYSRCSSYAHRELSIVDQQRRATHT